MSSAIDNKQVIKNLLTSQDENNLSIELQIPHSELQNYLNQLINNVSKEIAPDIYIMPYTGSLYLQEFISKYNKKIIEQWLFESKRKFPPHLPLKELIEQILQNYDRIEILATHFQLTSILDFKEYLFSILITRFVEYFEKGKFQVCPNTFLIGIELQSDLTDFLSILNRELSFEVVPYIEPHNLVVEFSDHVEDLEQRYDQVNKSLMSEFINKFQLKLPPDNQHTQFVETKKKHLIQVPKDEIGTFQIFKGYQSFKVLCNLKNELFESNQFVELLEERKHLIGNKMLVKKFKQLFDPTAIPDGQVRLSADLLRQIEETKVNTRELRENFYRFVFMNLFSKLEKKDNTWGFCVFQNKYYQNMVVPNTWTKQIKVMLLKFKTYKMNLRRRKNKKKTLISSFPLCDFQD